MTTLVAAGESAAHKRAMQAAENINDAIDRVTLRVLPLIEAALENVADKFVNSLTSAGEPIDQTDAQRIANLWWDEVPEIAAVVSRVYVGSTNVAMQQLGAARNITEGLREAYLTTATNRLNDVGNALWAESTAALTEGVRLGEGYDQLRERLQTTFAAGGTELGETRAVRIARTEVQSAVNRGTQDAVQSLPDDRRPQYKSWLATLGPQTREAHAEADGQTVPIDQPFEVDGELLEYPGDPAGSPGNIIQCRCTMIYTDNPNGFDTAGTRQLGQYEVNPCGRPTSLAAAADDAPEMGYEIEDYDAGDDEYCSLLDDPLMQLTGDATTFANDSDGSETWVSEHYADWQSSLSQAEQRNIKQYTEDVYDDVNGALRRAGRGESVDLDVWESMTNAIDNALARTSAPNDVTVFRQVAGPKDNPFWKDLRPGDEFIDHGYVSTSLSNTDVFGPTSPAYVRGNFRITVPQGAPGGPLARVGGKTGDDLALALREDEFLLPRGTKFRVKSVADDGSLDLEVVT